ncbi:unnamed protein product [Peronospora belbahrii]|uniref:SWIRM domain-containing protein n=1 Tax=Peronospora belbahrii TaxID=622444 RepID=A0AAU9L7E7_9STRA|nr:unnamed protein product [Peronospora belbahrii]CAH0514364.1 unnamed protein product [Peronospora belbahrii]
MTPPMDSAVNISTTTTSHAPRPSLLSSSSPYLSNVMPLNTNNVSETGQTIESDPLTDHDDSEGAKTIAVPRCSTWFAMDKINPIEKRMLPEFFVENGSKTAEIYLKYRNYMVHAYRQQPGVYLTATACRRNLTGDACAILRVHEFLTHWGLINFDVPPHAMPPAMHSNYALKRVESTVKCEDKSPIAMLVAAKKENARRVDVPLACEACGTARGVEDAFFGLTSEAKKKLMSCGASTNVGNANHSITTGANGKAGEDKEMTVGGFALRPGSAICEKCYIRGAFPEGYDASDFVMMPTVATNSLAAASWTEEETNLMLDAVSSTRSNKTKGMENEEDDDSCDWNYVASRVGSKTAEECLLHFLELPMLDQSVPTPKTRLEDSIHSLRPFTPGAALNALVLDLVALVEQVDPMVAKAAAHAAICAIKRLHTMPATSTTLPGETYDRVENSDARGPAGKVKVESAPPGSGLGKTSDSATSSFESAVAAVATSAEVAGIGGTVKLEDVSVDGDVAMGDGTATIECASKAGDSVNRNAVSISKEMMAVTEEAANATTIALLATRAQQTADNIANGPVRDLVNQLLENQLRQMELKMQQLAVLEQAIDAEKEQVAKEKYQLYVDRLSFAREKMNYRSTKLGL